MARKKNREKMRRLSERDGNPLWAVPAHWGRPSPLEKPQEKPEMTPFSESLPPS